MLLAWLCVNNRRLQRHAAEAEKCCWHGYAKTIPDRIAMPLKQRTVATKKVLHGNSSWALMPKHQPQYGDLLTTVYLHIYIYIIYMSQGTTRNVVESSNPGRDLSMHLLHENVIEPATSNVNDAV